MSDRIAGALLLVISLWYVATASSYGTSYGDPLGPSAFPRIVGVPAILFSLSLLVWPDPDPAWERGRPLLRQAAAVATLIGYALLLERLGFVLATFLAVAALGLLMRAPPARAALSALVMSPVLFVIFDRLLGLPLPLLPKLPA